MDEFAQSREDDDLFADEFEPLPTPTTTVDQTEPAPAPTPIPTQPRAAAAKPNQQGGGASQQQQSHQQQQRNGRQEGGRDRRGRGGSRGGSNGLGQSRYATQADSSPSSTATQQAIPPPIAPSTTTNTTIPPSVTSPSDSTTTPSTVTNTPITTDNTRIHAVRGDRSATGGPAHKKLTEEELTEKMAKMAILNAQKAEKHRLTEADQAAFQHREKELAKERREKAIAEKKNERVMEMERAKNRERKMKAQGGREWDSEKLESDIVDGKGRGRSSEFVRGGHGGVIRGGLAGSKYSVDDGEGEGYDNQSSRGRGGFEIRGRGRGGRGGRGGKAANTNAVPTAEDFPSLPTAAKASEPKSSEVAKTDTTSDEKVPLPTTDKAAGDWAEEMATPLEQKKIDV
ncbi:hypothetical protein VTL71DRAFT_10186 [Oculimacula yallundae]|uniref:Uncharacterized protein n=1 Tax=Oculimacula yallundae TaxID=86028 RepID=A0ABR4BPU7_9HELO